MMNSTLQDVTTIAWKYRMELEVGFLTEQAGHRNPVGIKRLQDVLRVTVAQNKDNILSSYYCFCSASVVDIKVNVAGYKLQLLSDYYCWKDYADRDEINDLSENR
ncbi:hypothetical protein Tco_0665252 [Tanacetum coccineum]